MVRWRVVRSEVCGDVGVGSEDARDMRTTQVGLTWECQSWSYKTDLQF